MRELSPKQKRIIGDRRLLKLATFLEKLPSKDFNYSHWIGSNRRSNEPMHPGCGTTACALGWAASMPEFRRLGLRIIPYNAQFNDSYKLIGIPLPDGNRLETYAAAQKIFHVDHDQAQFLFRPGAAIYGLGDFDRFDAPGSDATPKQVAKHIRQFVKRIRKLTTLHPEKYYA